MTTIRTTFTTPFDQHADREGQPFELVRVIDTPDQDHDAEVLPMYVIRFADGHEIEAWPEEVLDRKPEDPPFPTTPAGWEDAYHLPRGVIEAIVTCPAPARIAEIIAQVRDAALEAAGAPVPGR